MIFMTIKGFKTENCYFYILNILNDFYTFHNKKVRFYSLKRSENFFFPFVWNNRLTYMMKDVSIVFPVAACLTTDKGEHSLTLTENWNGTLDSGLVKTFCHFSDKTGFRLNYRKTNIIWLGLVYFYCSVFFSCKVCRLIFFFKKRPL